MSAAEADTLRVRTSVWADVTAVAGSAAVNAAATEILKHSVHARRPDGSSLDSWPSRHTSWAFAILGSAGYRAARYSGWWLVGAHTAANIVALQRVAAGRHYPTDVLGGAATGIASVAAGELFSRLIFHGQPPVFYKGDMPAHGSVDAFTAAIIPLGRIGDGQELHTGVMTGLRYTCRLNDTWGLGAEASTSYFPLDRDGMRQPRLHTVGMAVGAVARFGIGIGDIEARMMAGAQHNSRTGTISRWSMTGSATGAVMFNISRSAVVGAEAGYEFRTMGSLLSAVSISIISRVRF